MKLIALILIKIAAWLAPCEHRNYLTTPAPVKGNYLVYAVDHYTCLNCGKKWKP